MKRVWIAAAAVSAALALSPTAHAQGAPLAIPGEPIAKDLPGARELPDPKMDYKVVFVLGQAAASPDQENPGLKNVSEFVNTLAAHGVPADKRHVAVVIHQKATPMILDAEAFKARTGHDNTDLALIKAMTKAGVKFYVCGQAVLGAKIDPKTITPEVELTLWAETTLVNLELRGYVPVGGG
jgi:intracellular sulfur oxidation DsrE/DsrF family protein